MARRINSGADGVSDETLLAAMAIGDERAGVAFVRRYQARVFGLALTIVTDATLAEDVAQEALIRVWRHAVVFDARRGAVAPWVLTITRNIAIDALRARRSIPIQPDDLVWHGLMSTEATPEDASLIGDAVDRARVGMQALSLEQRRAVVLSAMYGWTAAEIAHAESIPLGTAKGRIRVGMERLRSALASEGSE